MEQKYFAKRELTYLRIEAWCKKARCDLRYTNGCDGIKEDA